MGIRRAQCASTNVDTAFEQGLTHTICRTTKLDYSECSPLNRNRYIFYI